MNETGRGLFPWEDDRAAGPADEPQAVQPDDMTEAGGAEASPTPVTSGTDAASAGIESPQAPPPDAGEEASPPDAGEASPPGASAQPEPVPGSAAEGSDAGPRATQSAPADRAAARRPEPGQRHVVRKEYYSISEVADIVGLPAHVLRYWETQFSVLNPSKNRSGNRVYQRKEIKLILLVKQLLHDEKYTVEGARQKLDQLRRGGGIGPATGQALDEQLLHVLREDLQALSQLLRTDTE